MTHRRTPKKDRSRYFDWFILAGLGMNGLVVLTLIGFWLFH
jgi:hypothetical protein